MTYLHFHLAFILPPLLLLGAYLWAGRRTLHPRALLYLGAMALVALVYTTPWDNYLIWRGVWSYGPDRVVGTIGYVPVEEYLFFLLQPLLTGLWLYAVLTPLPWPLPGSSAGGRRSAGAGGAARIRWTGAVLYFMLAGLGAVLLQSERGTYLGLILAWAAPVLGLQWAFAGPEIWVWRRAFLLGVAVPTAYLWVADAVAIGAGIWSISPSLTTGLHLGGFPLEEAVFFLVTNLLVVQGLLLFLFPPAALPGRRPGRPSSVVRQPSRTTEDGGRITESERPGRRGRAGA